MFGTGGSKRAPCVPPPGALRRGGWRVALGVGILSCALSARAQDEAAKPSAPADDVEIVVEFQRLIEHYLQLPLRPDPEAFSDEQMPQWRADMADRIGGLLSELDALLKRSGRQADILLVKSLLHARLARVILDDRRELDAKYSAMRDRGLTQMGEQERAAFTKLARERAELAKRTAEEFDRVADVLQEALAAAEVLSGEREATLIRGVVLAQSAIVGDRALEAATDAELGVGAVRVRDMQRLLDSAAELIGAYMRDTDRDSGLEWVRGQFYSGVVEYRRALVPRTPGDADYRTRVQSDRIAIFERSRAIFATLSRPDEVLAMLEAEGAEDASPAQRAFDNSGFAAQALSTRDVSRFYAAAANLYLGLIAAVDPEIAPDDANTRLSRARSFLDLAAEFDRTDSISSLTEGLVPRSVKIVLSNLERAVEQSKRQPLNDLTLSFGVTPLFDSNVLLLGRNTEAPLSKRRKRDFRVGAEFKLQHVIDLDALAPGDPLLRKWQLLIEGRTSQTWNARIGDFNEQFYGATINLRYELLVHDANALFLNLRYDYDYVLLGNNGFLRDNRLRPSLQFSALDGVVTGSVFFNYEDRNYLEVLRDERFNRDGDYFSWGADVIVDLSKWLEIDGESMWQENVWGSYAPQETDTDAWRRPLEVQIGVEFTTNSTAGTEFDYGSLVLRLGAEIPLPYGWDFRPQALFEWQNYRGNSLVDRNRRGREDFIQDYVFRLERKFYLSRDYSRDYQFVNPLRLDRTVMTVFGDLRFTIDDSNVRDRLGQSVFEYNRVIYGAGVRFDID